MIERDRRDEDVALLWNVHSGSYQQFGLNLYKQITTFERTDEARFLK